MVVVWWWFDCVFIFVCLPLAGEYEIINGSAPRAG